jgi:hypothetical protein
MPRRKALWRCGIVHKPMREVLASGFDHAPVTWFAQEPAYTFLADPFGLWHGDALHVFAEQYDYRSRHGRIERLTFDRQFGLVERRLALREPWHLSYPYVFEGEGATWMLPEAHKSGTLTLYRAHGVLEDWRPECEIKVDCVPVDATILRHRGRWWLFYAPATSRAAKIGELRVAWADRRCGPWHPHRDNPVRRDPGSSRPGGTPMIIDDAVVLPTQDCHATYGGAVVPLWITRLDTDAFTADAASALERPNGAPIGCAGMHTISECGPVTLVDVKTIDRSLKGLRIELERLFRWRAAK